MQRTNIWYVFACLSFAFAVGCDRPTSNKTSVTLQIPKELQEKLSANDATTLRLVHLALQISGPGLDKVYTNILDTHDDNSSLPAEISIAEIPSGDNRVIQVLAAYAEPHSDSALIYYGDVTQALKNPSEVIPVNISKLGGSGASTMARITGRYLTSANGGPTGELQMVYRPAGKPAMAVDKKPIVGGWFEVSTFQDVPVDYVLLKDGAPTNIVIGSQWTNSSFTPSNQLVRMNSPSGYRAYWNGSSTAILEAREAQIQIVGFFAANSSFLSDKKVCLSTTTNKNNGTLHYSGSLVTADEDTARPVKYFPTGTTATVSNDSVTFEGGLPSVSCGTLSPQDEYNKYLWFFTASSTAGYIFSEDLTRGFGLNEAFVGMQYPNYYNDSKSRNYYATVRYSAANGLHYSLQVLPGLESVVDGVRIYKRAPNVITSRDDRCDRIDTSVYTLIKSGTAQFSGSNLIIKMSDIPLSAGEFGVCLTIKDKAFGRIANGGIWGPYVPADLLTFYFPYPNTMAHQDECQRLNIQTGVAPVLDGNGHPLPRSPYLDRASYTFTVNTDYSGTSASVLYADSACSGTATSSVSGTISAPDDTKAVYFKPSNTEPITFSLTGIPSGITANPYTLTVSDQSQSMTKLALETDIDVSSYEPGVISAFPNGCFPFKVVPKSSSNDSVKYTGSVTVSLVDVNNSTIAPSQMRFYSSCSSITEISGGVLSFSNESSKSFVMKTTTLLKDVKLKLFASGGTTYIPINPIPQAYQLTATVPSSISSGACIPITVKALDKLGADKNLIRSSNFSLNSSPNTDVSFYSNGSCTGTTTSTYTLAGGTSQTIAFAKFLSAGPFQLNINGNYVDFDIGYVNLNLNVTAGPLTISSSPSSGSVVANSTASFLISGGKAPFSVTGSHANITTSTVLWTPDGYVLSLTFASGASGATSIGISDGNGALATLNITVNP